MENAASRTLSFKVMGREPLSGVVRNPDATIGSVAPKIAERLGIAGTFEVLDAKGQTLSPSTRLADLPDKEELTLASELTPASL
jgi:hypothetical protein